MKALSKKSVIIALSFFASLLAVVQVYAGAWCACYSDYKACPYVPTAYCTASGTRAPLPPYMCCKLVRNGHTVWRNTWVAGTCRMVNPCATPDLGCSMNSPLYGTGCPIPGNCYYSPSTGIYR